MDITEAKYVSLTTHRETGEGVATPVWIVDLGGDAVGVVTDPSSGKVRRVRSDPTVTMIPCDVRGGVSDGADTVSGTAIVVSDGPQFDAIRTAVRAKYGLTARAIDLAHQARIRLGRGTERVGIVVSLESREV